MRESKRSHANCKRARAYGHLGRTSGYTATCEEIQAAISQGETIQEALDNLDDAMELCMDAKEDSKKPTAWAR